MSILNLSKDKLFSRAINKTKKNMEIKELQNWENYFKKEELDEIENFINNELKNLLAEYNNSRKVRLTESKTEEENRERGRVHLKYSFFSPFIVFAIIIRLIF